MNKKISNTTMKLAAGIQILALTFLASCSTVDANALANVCHATGDSANPYGEIMLDSTELMNEHRGHAEDIFPVPMGGCPTSLVEVVDGKITICHATDSEANSTTSETSMPNSVNTPTSSETNAYEEISVSVNGLNGHNAHEGDLIPMPAEGCPAVGNSSTMDEVAVCHVTTDAAMPYEEIMVSNAELNEYLMANPHDINPVPEGGCPAVLVMPTNADDVAVCHVTTDAAMPYEEIMVPNADLNEYLLANPHDINPVPEGGCPAVLVMPDGDETAVCHVTGDAANPYDVVMVNDTELDAYVLANSNDINPMPSMGCPAYMVEVLDGQVMFCHANDDESRSYEEVVVGVDGLDGHAEHEEDVFPMSATEGCPASAVVVNDGKITICHATSSKKNPFVEITVSMNALNGHNKHNGDIIPAPADGCKP